MSRIEEALRRASGEAETSGGLELAQTELLEAVRETTSAIDLGDYRSEDRPVRAAVRPAPTAVPVVEAPIEAPGISLRAADAPPRPADVTPQALDSPKKAVDEKLILSPEMLPGGVEQYRKLAAVLHQVQADKGIKIVMIASAMAGEGKTLTAANLVLTLSKSFQRKVLLIDADLRRPSAHTVFQLPNGPGLNEALTAPADEKIRLVEASPNLWILPAGRPNPDPMSSLISDRMRRIVEDAAAKFEWVVIDTPPIALLPDANLLAQMVDAVVFVVGAGSTPFHMIQRALKAMDRERLLGVVLNRVVESNKAYGYHEYYGPASNCA